MEEKRKIKSRLRTTLIFGKRKQEALALLKKGFQKKKSSRRQNVPLGSIMLALKLWKVRFCNYGLVR
jgi:ABC-type proline/glycine betaine transport system ATPase subunit